MIAEPVSEFPISVSIEQAYRYSSSFESQVEGIVNEWIKRICRWLRITEGETGDFAAVN
jgi:hypothetical protein